MVATSIWLHFIVSVIAYLFIVKSPEKHQVHNSMHRSGTGRIQHGAYEQVKILKAQLVHQLYWNSMQCALAAGQLGIYSETSPLWLALSSFVPQRHLSLTRTTTFWQKFSFVRIYDQKRVFVLAVQVASCHCAIKRRPKRQYWKFLSSYCKFPK